jgi:hypothetical protein
VVTNGKIYFSKKQRHLHRLSAPSPISVVHTRAGTRFCFSNNLRYRLQISGAACRRRSPGRSLTIAYSNTPGRTRDVSWRSLPGRNAGSDRVLDPEKNRFVDSNLGRYWKQRINITRTNPAEPKTNLIVPDPGPIRSASSAVFLASQGIVGRTIVFVVCHFAIQARNRPRKTMVCSTDSTKTKR